VNKVRPAPDGPLLIYKMPCRVRAVDLEEGTEILFEERRLRVLGEPLLVHRGWSLFDEFRFYLEVSVTAPGDPLPQVLQLPLDAEVEIAEPAEGDR
jgi:hypothetical protein